MFTTDLFSIHQNNCMFFLHATAHMVVMDIFLTLKLLQELCAVYEEHPLHVTKHEGVSLPISIDDTSSTTLDTRDKHH